MTDATNSGQTTAISNTTSSNDNVFPEGGGLGVNGAGGTENVDGSGTADGATVYGGGVQNVNSGGIANNTAVSGGNEAPRT